MARKPKKGYFYQGKFIVEDSQEDLEIQHSSKGAGVSKTDLKKLSTELQKLGEDLLTLGNSYLTKLDLSEKLTDAIAHAKQITSFEGKRRQMQFIGKLMRLLDQQEINAIRDVVEDARSGGVKHTQQLHLVEQWRQHLVDSDNSLQEWLQLYPDSDVQTMRNLIRQIRKTQLEVNAEKSLDKGISPRQNKAFRSLFKIIQQQLELPEQEAEQ